MTVVVETLEKLERKITLKLPVDAVQNEVQARLRKLARTVKMDGFRPGKVPMNVVAALGVAMSVAQTVNNCAIAAQGKRKRDREQTTPPQ